LWSIVNKDVLTVAIDLRDGSFWEFRTWMCLTKVLAIILGAVEEFEGVLQAVEM
jgi:hypothetical protein